MKTIFAFLKKHRYAVLMTAAILICLWPISFFVLTPKWDNVNGFLPYRYFISDYLWNGHFPYWNSFQQMGYPIYADPQGGMWNPITWIIMLFGKYTMTSLIIELLSYFLLAGWGMYWFVNIVLKNTKVAAIIGLSYALSGPMVGTAQIMVFLAGVAWLPWCLGALYLFVHRFKYKYAVLTGLFVALNTVSASPAYTIILVYLFFFVFLIYFWKNRMNFVCLKKLTFGGIVLIGTAVILLLPYLASGIEFAPYFNRMKRLPYSDYLLSNPFIFPDYISFIFPYGVLSKSDFFNETDISLRSGYIGLLALLFAALATVRKHKEKRVIWLIIIAVSTLIAALGSNTFIYRILYNFPGFGVFRHPSFFRTYTLFALLILAAIGLKNFFEKPIFTKKEKVLLMGFIGIILGLGTYSYFATSTQEIKNNITDFLNWNEFSNQFLATHIVINMCVIIFALLVTFLIKKSTKITLFGSFFLFVFLDMGIQTQLATPTNITYNFNINYSNFKTYFQTLPKNIQQNDLDKPLKHFDENQGLYKIPGIWVNVSTYHKTISYVGYNPLEINYFSQVKADSLLVYNLENPLFFFADNIREDTSYVRPGLIWSDKITQEGISSDSTTISNPKVDYNAFSAEIVNADKSPQWLVLNQNYYPKWKAYLNGEELTVERVNTNLMGIQIPSGKNGIVEFKIASPLLPYLAGISVFAYLLVGLSLIWNYFYRQREKLK